MLLKSKFENNNIEEFKTYSKNRSFKFEDIKLQPPSFTFYDDRKIQRNYYDFKIDNYTFTDAFISPHSKDENGIIKYICNSY